MRHLLVSGDHGRDSYDEPTWMCDALVARGVPRSAITLDYAGFRTLDSMARAQAVFGLHRFTIVTDDFHQARSIFLARSLGLEVVGFPSERVPYWWSKKVRTRELASRTRRLPRRLCFPHAAQVLRPAHEDRNRHDALLNYCII